MKYFLAFLLMLSCPVRAQENISPSSRLPRCDAPALMEALNAKVAEYYAGQPAENITTRRRQALILKNMEKFEEIDITSFQPSDNYQVANLIMMKKMNLGLVEADMRICKNEADSILSEVYLLIYPDNGMARASLINFTNNSANREFFVEFPLDPLENSEKKE